MDQPELINHQPRQPPSPEVLQRLAAWTEEIHTYFHTEYERGHQLIPANVIEHVAELGKTIEAIVAEKDQRPGPEIVDACNAMGRLQAALGQLDMAEF